MRRYYTKNPKTPYPVGATWEGKNDRGMIGRIWLEERREYFEVWKYNVMYDDGSGHGSEWYMSYRKCREEIPLHNKDYSAIKFKRVK